MSSSKKPGRCCHGLLEFFIAFDADPKDVDETEHQRAKLALRAFFLYMFYVSNVLIVAVLSQSPKNYLLAHALEYHLIHAQFSSKATWMESNAQLNPSGNINVKYRQASRIQFREIATFADVRGEETRGGDNEHESLDLAIHAGSDGGGVLSDPSIENESNTHLDSRSFPSDRCHSPAASPRESRSVSHPRLLRR